LKIGYIVGVGIVGVWEQLDDIKVADGLLLENGVGKHTLITTRNPKTAGIPAEPLEVPLLSADDCLNPPILQKN